VHNNGVSEVTIFIKLMYRKAGKRLPALNYVVYISYGVYLAATA
jgi:hypothetical protein